MLSSCPLMGSVLPNESQDPSTFHIVLERASLPGRDKFLFFYMYVSMTEAVPFFLYSPPDMPPIPVFFLWLEGLDPYVPERVVTYSWFQGMECSSQSDP